MTEPTPEPTTHTEKTWMTYKESEIYTGIGRVSLWRAVKLGNLRAGGVGRAVRFHRDELDRWMRGDKEN